MNERPNPICSHCGQVIETDDYSFVHAQKGETLAMMAEKALQQIEEKRYAEEPINEGYRKIIKYGIAFMGKRCLIKLG